MKFKCRKIYSIWFSGLFLGLSISFLLLGSIPFAANAQTDFPFCSLVQSTWVNQNGQYFHGAAAPFGMSKTGPTCVGFPLGSGYAPDKAPVGFAHTHLNASFLESSFGLLLVRPHWGEPQWKIKEYDSFTTEAAGPGFFSGRIGHKSGEIGVQITARENQSRERWIFHPSEEGKEQEISVLVDPTFSLIRGAKPTIKSKFFKVEADGSFFGRTSISAENQNFTIFYSGQVSVKNPLIRLRKDTIRLPNKKWKLDTTAFAFVGKIRGKEEIELTLCFSYKNAEEASQSLQRAITMNLEEIRKKSQMAWEDRLSVLQIPNAPLEDKQKLTTALYRTLVSPSDVSGNHPEDQFGEAHFWDQVQLAAAAQVIHPLHNLLFVPHQRRFFNSLIRTGESKNGLPEAWISGYFGKNEGGASAEIILAEAIQKGIISGIEAGKAWKICMKNALESSPQPEWYGRSQMYLDQGYEGTKTEYGFLKNFRWAFSDFTLSALGQKLDKPLESKKLWQRSFQVLQLFHPDKKCFWPKDSSGKWMPEKGKNASLAALSGWKAILEAPHLLDTVAVLLGGKDKLEQKLDSLILLPSIAQNPVYSLVICRYFYVSGQKEKVEKLIFNLRNQIQMPSTQTQQTDPSAVGMAAFILTGLGLLPFPGKDSFGIIPPAIFPVEVTVSGGKTIVIKGKGKRPFWNGKEWKQPFFKQSDLVAGGVLEWK